MGRSTLQKATLCFSLSLLGTIGRSRGDQVANEKPQVTSYSDEARPQPETQAVGPFGTLNNKDNSFVIPADKAQDLLNVDITPGGRSIKKRRGFSLAYATTYTTSAIHGVYNFYDSNGNNIVLEENDVTLMGSINSAALTTIISTMAFGKTLQCTDSQGNAYCVDTNRDPIIKTNGATYSQIAVNNNGSIIAVTPDRLALSGFGGTAPNRIDFSKSGDFTTWTPATTPPDPIQFTIAAPGSKITHLTYAFNRTMWFKDSSFGYILSGPTQGDWIVRTVSPNIGTLDNSSVYWQGYLYWRGQDGHFYQFDGSYYQRMSRDIGATIGSSQNHISNSWLQTSQSDFQAGVCAPSYYCDTTDLPGSIIPTFPDFLSTLRDGTGGTKNVWTTAASGSATGSTGAGFINNNGGQAGKVYLRTTSLLQDFQVGTTYHFRVTGVPTDATGGSAFYFNLSSSAPSGTTDPDAQSNYFYYVFTSTNANVVYLGGADSQGDGSLYASQQITVPFNFDFYIATTTFQISVNNVVNVSGTHTFPHNLVYAYFEYKNTTAGLRGATFQNFGITPETITFDSAVHNAPNITSWDTFNATLTGTPQNATHSFYMASSNSSFAIGAQAYTVITNNNVPAISTGTYFEVRDVIKNTQWNDQPELDDFTVNWFEGNASDKVYGTYFDQSIWWAATVGSGQTTNNRIIKFDLLNQGWLLYDIPANGMYVLNGNLYFGNANSGKIEKYGSNDDDDGAAINSYWKSKDFFGSDPFLEKELTSFSFIGTAVSNSSMTVTYTTDGNSSTSYTIPLSNGSNAFRWSLRPLQAGAVGHGFNVKMGNNAASQPWEIYAAQFGLSPRPWFPTNP